MTWLMLRKAIPLPLIEVGVSLHWLDEFLYIFRYTMDEEEFFPHWFSDEFKIVE